MSVSFMRNIRSKKECCSTNNQTINYSLCSSHKKSYNYMSVFIWRKSSNGQVKRYKNYKISFITNLKISMVNLFQAEQE